MPSIPRQLWASRRERPVLVIVSVVTIVTLLGWLPVEHHLREMGMGLPYTFNDFSAYTEALNRWLEGTQMYVPQENGGYFGEYLYPPVTVLAFYPFETTGFHTGAVLFGFTAIVLLWLGLEAMARTLGYRLRIWERLGLLVMLFSFQPVIRNFRWAQTATLLTASLAFAFYFQERAESETSPYSNGAVSDRTRSLYRYASGACTTLGSSFKLFYATSGAHLLRDRKRFAGAMAAAAGLAVASLAIFGLETNLQYLDVLTWGKGWGEAKAMYAWDTAAAYRPLYAFGGLGLYLKIFGILTVIGLTLAARTSDSRAARHTTFALGIAAVPLFAPKADSHDLVVLVVPAVILLAHELDRPDGYAWIPVLSVLLVHVHRYALEFLTKPEGNFPGAALLYDFGPYLQPGMWGTFLLVGLAGYRVAEHATLPALGSVRDRLGQ
ncbi:glycosyltransferase family 87 protein [Halorhabdus rudnickae]|uniref:glycosyltransferase family 87 protein n=1 Tax=Halorhabdus rudnickae TaxID=1775544 RepID=UPI0014384F7B|nr:glycosyltransferase family 87 protein [Halorhabdus rudnickae]